MSTVVDSQSAVALVEIQKLRVVIDEVSHALKSQQELLKMRDLTLNPALLESLKAVESDLYRLETILISESTELEQLNALVQTSAMVNSSLDLDTILAQAMDEILNLTRAGRGFILLENPNTGELEHRITRDNEPEIAHEEGLTDEEANLDSVAYVSRTLLNEVMATGKPLLTDNAQNDPRLAGSETIARFVLRSVMCVPLIYRDRLKGAIYVDNRFRVGVFTERELNLLTAFANQTAVAIENAILFGKVQTSLREITQIKELMESVFASITSGVITTNADDIVTTFNRAAGDILLRAAETTIGQPLDDLLPRMQIDQYLSSVRDGEPRVDAEIQPDVPGRGRIALALRFTPLKNATQDIQGAALVIDDLTEQRERDEALNLMTRYLPPGMVENIHHIAELALGGERREMTCVFLEVIPYKQLASSLRPQQMMDMLNIYLETATIEINKAQGIVDKYMGTDIMVLFNTQLNPDKNHALAAVNMALAVRDAFVNLYARLGIAPDVHYYRAGIHTGVATLGNVGSLNRRSFTAIGDTINLAKRIEENASSGQIMISEETMRAIKDAPGIRLEERQAVQVKGRQQLTRRYEVFRS